MPAVPKTPMSIFTEEELARIGPEAPKCRQSHSRAQRNQCETCKARKSWLQRIRNIALRKGARVVGVHRADLTPVRRCRTHRRHHAGCPDCRRWGRYDSAVRRKQNREGTAEPMAPVAVVQKHLAALLDKNTGGWIRSEIIARTGIGRNSLYTIMAGRVKYVRTSTWHAIRALQPRNRPAPRRSNEVPALEVRRITQGLAAQGWTFQHMAKLLHYKYRDTASDLAHGTSRWVTTDTLETARKLRAVLGPYDINVLRTPLPGMNRTTATRCRNLGWVPLAAWAGQDITDPAAVPYGKRLRLVDPIEDDPAPAGDEELLPYIDPVLLPLVRQAAEKADAIGEVGTGKRAAAWTDPLGRVTVLERYAVTAYGTHLGMTAAEVGALLGYPVRTDQEHDAAERAVCRFREHLTAVRKWIDSDPAGETPDWYRKATTSHAVDAYLPALLALLPEPVGPGWSVTEMAKRCGVPEDEMNALVRRAAVLGDRSWSPQVKQQQAA